MNECLGSFLNRAADNLRDRMTSHRLLTARLGPYLAPSAGLLVKLKSRGSAKSTSFAVSRGIVACHAWVWKSESTRLVITRRGDLRTAQPCVRDPPSVSRTCDRMATPMGLRGRDRYRCLAPGCICAKDGVARMENNLLKHERPRGIIAGYCNEPGVGRDPAQKYYRCRFCASAFSWVYLLGNHEEKRRARRGAKEIARGSPRARPWGISSR